MEEWAMLPIVLFFLLAFPLCWMAVVRDPWTMLFIWGLSVTSWAMYIAVRKMEKTGNFGQYKRAGIGIALMAKADAILLSSAMAWTEWPIQNTMIFFLALLLFVEGRRLSKGWKLFIPLRKQ